ncbi:YciI family protein [Pseudodesulfovibrio sp.]|uniref:YciI family protein n=1 Tax=unclassified Pseudodesulfovibrio TaxID=2661612 RepID=UPI003B0002EC
MFIVDLAYVVPLSTVDAHLEAHVAYLKEQYEKGIFVASGRKEPRTGGVILANCRSLSALRSVLDKDPFKRNGLACYTITEFMPSMTAAGLEALKE